jgi:replicative DNA helicase
MNRKRDANRGGPIDYRQMTDSRVEQLRIPPQSIEAEQAVLGGAMLAPDAFDRIADRLQESDFYRRDHQLIFRAMLQLSEQGTPYDAVTLGEWFESNGFSELVAGGAYLIELASTTPSAANISAYADIVRDKAILRQLIDAGTGIVNDAFQPEGRDSEEILAAAQQAIGDIGVDKDNGGLRMVASTARAAWESLVNESQRTGTRPTSTPLDSVNEILMPFGDENVVTLAAATSAGKTAMAMMIAEHYAENRGEHVAVFSLEMSPKELVMRMAAKRGRVDGMRLQTPELLTDDEWHRLNVALKEIQRLKIAIDDSAGIGLRELRARARRMKKAVGRLGLIVIDYVQLMDTPKRDTREQGISALTRGIKRLAKELKTPILQLSQLSRKADERGFPVLSDLRESGSIEQDSDTVVFLHHDGGCVVLSIPKQRNGRRNVSRKLVPELQHFTFRDWDPLTDDQPNEETAVPRKRRSYGADTAKAAAGGDR